MKVEKIGVVGFGLMGREIGRLSAQSGYQVIAQDVSNDILSKGIEEVKGGRWGLEKAVEKGKIKKEQAEEAFNRISTTTDLEEVCKRADYIIEATPEDLELKKKLFKELDALSPPEVILASNTSSLSITHIASAASKAERVIGTHFFQPVAAMALVEIVMGMLTGEETLEVTRELMVKLERKLAIVKDMGTGFPSVRLTHALAMEASRIVEEGVATPKDVDTILKYGYRHPIGPFEMSDWIGLDMRARVWEEMYKLTKDSKWNPPALMKQLIAAGYLGDPKKGKGSKGGYYDYFKLSKE